MQFLNYYIIFANITEPFLKTVLTETLRYEKKKRLPPSGPDCRFAFCHRIPCNLWRQKLAKHQRLQHLLQRCRLRQKEKAHQTHPELRRQMQYVLRRSKRMPRIILIYDDSTLIIP